MSMGNFDPTSAPFDDGSGFAMDDVDADKPGTGGGGGLPEGDYCVAITEVIVQNAKGSTEVKLEVLKCADESLIGRAHTEYLGWPNATYEDSANRIRKEDLLAWCYAAKTTSPAEIKARQQARQGFDSSWLTAMVGKYVIVTVKPAKPYTDKQTGEQKSGFRKIEGMVWALDNPKAKGKPGWIDISGQQQAAAGQQSSQPTQQQQQQAEADPFANLV